MNRHPANGFVLVEVLMAITVLMVGAVFVARSFQASSLGTRESRELYAASLFMEAQAAETERGVALRESAQEDPHLGSVTIAREQSLTEMTQLARHQVTLSWGHGRRARSMEHTFYAWE